MPELTNCNVQNLKAYYRFESGALTTDSSGENHTLTAISDPAEGTGKFGGAVDLDGNDAYSAADHADFKPTGNFTVGAWVKTTGDADDAFVLVSYSQNTKVAGWGLYIGYVSSTVGMAKFITGKNTGTTVNTDWKLATGTVDIVDGNWHFIVATWDGSNIKVYTDGGDEVSVAWTYAPAYAATNYVRVGCNNLTGTNTQFLTGSLDDVFLLNGTALTAYQVKEIYEGRSPAFLMNLASNWKNN
jgi:hypothetical protein